MTEPSTKRIEVTVWHENRATVEIDVPVSVRDTGNETTGLVTELALREVDAGRAYFRAVDGGTEWGLAT